MKITVGIRRSTLSQKQFEEIVALIRPFTPHLEFEPVLVETIGDRSLQESLRDKDKTDFFTRDIDRLQLEGGCRLAVHSAKDLPDPLPKGLKLIALTKGQDPSDSLVFREGETLETLPPGARIGSSSKRRDKMILKMRGDLLCVEVRGTIEMRLRFLEEKAVDGLVLAEAALIRLGLNPSRIKLPGVAAPLQGKLAIIAKEDDHEMATLFSSIDQDVPCQKQHSI